MKHRLVEWATEAVGRRPASIEKMAGATSSSLYRVRFDSGLSVVARLFTDRSWLAIEPDLATHEGAVLELLSGTDIPAPELVAVDPVGTWFGVPAVLMTSLSGRVELPDGPPDSWLSNLAETLLRVQAVDPTDLPWTYDPWIDALEPPAWSARSDLWVRAIERFGSGLPEEAAAFLHRDYHPANVLWTSACISGVVDWVNACVGPPSSDVAHCRLNLALMYGQEPADRFTDLLGRPYDPVWDLAPALSVAPDLDVYPPWVEFGLAGLTRQTLRDRLEEFVARAV